MRRPTAKSVMFNREEDVEGGEKEILTFSGGTSVLKVFILLMMTPNSPTLNDRYDFWGRCFRVVVASLE